MSCFVQSLCPIYYKCLFEIFDCYKSISCLLCLCHVYFIVYIRFYYKCMSCYSTMSYIYFLQSLCHVLYKIYVKFNKYLMLCLLQVYVMLNINECQVKQITCIIKSLRHAYYNLMSYLLQSRQCHYYYKSKSCLSLTRDLPESCESQNYIKYISKCI